MDVHFVDILRPEAVLADLNGPSVQSVLAELAQPVAAARGLDAKRLLESLLAREKLGSTGVGDGVAIPHCKVPGLAEVAASFGRSRVGVDFRSLDGKPTHLFVALFAPERAGAEHLQALARVSRLLKRAPFRQALLDAPDAAAMYSLIAEEDRQI